MILVTGPTGNNGRELIKRLSAAGAAVRGMMRNPLATDKLTAVEFVAGDFGDPESSRRALEGIERAFLVTKLN